VTTEGGDDSTEDSGSEAIPAFFHDRNILFPQRPAFVEGLLIRDVPQGLGIDFLGGPRRFILRGSQAGRCYEYLRSTLDGQNTLQDLLNNRPSELSRTSILATLKLLHERGVLVDGASSASRSTGDNRRVSRSEPHFATSFEKFASRKLGASRSAASGRELVERIEKAELLLVAGGICGGLAIELAGRAGFRKMRVVEIADSQLDELGPDAGVSVEQAPRFASLEDALTVIQAKAAESDLVVVCIDRFAQQFRSAINDLCLEIRRPLLYVESNGEEARLAFVQPYRSACLTCTDIRRSLTSDFALEDYLFTLTESTSETWLSDRPTGESITEAALISAYAISDATRYISGLSSPSYVNAVLQIDLLTSTTAIDRVVRVPRCPSCSRAPLAQTFGGDAGLSR